MSPKVDHRFVIGIDLGTTNCAMSYIDLWADRPELQVFAIEQWESTEALVFADTLPSFYYLPLKGDWKKGQARLPADPADANPDYMVGRAARDQLSATPERVVSSAKSWLCHGGVNRDAPILPWHSDDIIGEARKSPVDVSAAFLRHLKNAWDHKIGGLANTNAFDRQMVIITVPASFDEISQSLTLQAARLAGYSMGQVRLLEEPQAAFYYWLAEHTAHESLSVALTHSLPEVLERPQSVLICDMGGGTTDFSLFSVAMEAGELRVSREAVGEHLLLGGDNIDLSLAYAFEHQMTQGDRLPSRSWAALVAAARDLKERALSSYADDELHLSVAKAGAGLFGGTLSASMSSAAIRELVVEGFFPLVARDARPQTERDGLREMGLPYAVDSAVTKHLAAFLDGVKVDAVLFTGGTMKPPVLRERITQQITEWQGEAPLVLTNTQMDLACALGAGRYGYDLCDKGSMIRSGYARSLYAEVAQTDGSHALVCLVPKGHDQHGAITIDNLNLNLWTEQPVRFQLFSSRKRDEDKPGDLVAFGAGEFVPTAAVHTKLEIDGGTTKKVKPRLIKAGIAVQLTETGVLELACLSREDDIAKSWRLDFQVRTDDSDGGRNADSLTTAGNSKVVHEGRIRIRSYYGKAKKGDGDLGNARNLVRDLEQATATERKDWDIATLRQWWPDLADGMTRRGRSVGHELSWLYVAGYCLRPGYGVELDEWRVSELWRGYDLGLAHGDDRQVTEQWWIMWRRVAGGLNKDAQEKLFDKLFPTLRKGDEGVSPEVYMLVGSLERVSMDRKIKLGNQLVSQIASGKKELVDRKIWALSRMGSRIPLYAGPENIVRPKFIGDWYNQLRHLDPKQKHYRALTQFWGQAGRIVRDREFDLPDSLRMEFRARLAGAGAPSYLLAPLTEYVPMDEAARVQLFGEALPSGLVLSP